MDHTPSRRAPLATDASGLDRTLELLFASVRDAVHRDPSARDALETLIQIVTQREVERFALKATLSADFGHELRSRLNAVSGYADLLGEAVRDAALSRPHADARKLQAAVAELVAQLDTVPHWRRSPSPSLPQRPYVLVVDDDEDAYRIVRRHLRKVIDCDITWAQNGASALEHARNRRPNLITLDVCMPGVDGWDTLAQLKADPELASVPVVMMSILHEQGRGILLGADEYLTKPLDRARLTSVIERFAPRGLGRVLVVDDTESARELARRLLESAGYTVEEAVDGADALVRMKQRKPDLVLLDLMMPNVDGFEVVARMAADASLASIPTVVLTARQLDDADRERLAHAVESILPKGMPLSDLLDRVGAALTG